MPRFTLLLLLFLACSPGLSQASTLKYSVKGVQNDLKKNIESWLGSEPDTPEERANFVASADEDIASALKALGYYSPDIDITLDKSASPWRMRVEVAANEPVRVANLEILILGEAADDPEFEQLIQSSPFSSGAIFHHGAYETFKKQVIGLARQRGYFDGAFSLNQVEVNAEKLSASVRLYYESGRRYRFGEIFLDEDLAYMSWVDSVVNIQPGEWFEQSRLQEVRAQLQQTRFFSSVIVRPQLESIGDGDVPIIVNVAPANRHGFEFGVGFSTDTEERVSVTWRTPMLNRYGHSQTTRLEYSPIKPSGRFTYNIPLSHPTNDVLQLGAYLEDREYGDLDSRQRGVVARREIKAGQWIYSYSARTLDESWVIGPDHRDNDYVLPGASLSHKTRTGSLVDPEGGFHQVYLVEAAHHDIGSDINLFRAYGNFRYVATLAPKHRLVARAELGAVLIDDSDRPDLAPSLSFFAGGSQSIRGFAYQSIGNEVVVKGDDGVERVFVVGGDRLATASLEYQYYFTDTWRGAVFADGGDAFDVGEFDGHVGAGFGVHYLSPVGALRVELANDVSEDNPSWRLHLNIGAEF